jgi:hypothetical protein
MDVRTFVVGEGMKVEVGAALGGVRQNTMDRNVSFTMDNTLINPALLTKMQFASQPYIKNSTQSVALVAQLPLPSNYYTISNANTMVIKTGQHMGSVVIRPDSVNFLNDSLNTMFATYVLPFKITAADADSVRLKTTNTVAFRFENMLFGNYWHGGAAKISKANQPGVDSATVIYRWAINDPATKIWTLTTIGPNTVVTNGYYNVQTANNELKLVLKGSNVFVSTGPATVLTPWRPASAPTFTFSPFGASSYNQATLLQNRKIFLSYTFVSGKFTYRCTDTLYFRNRLRDGINEWQDENPDHYPAATK